MSLNLHSDSDGTVVVSDADDGPIRLSLSDVTAGEQVVVKLSGQN